MWREENVKKKEYLVCLLLPTAQIFFSFDNLVFLNDSSCNIAGPQAGRNYQLGNIGPITLK